METKSYPVHCLKCGNKTYRKVGPLGCCNKCTGLLVWTFIGGKGK
ncbi:hypothetical protein LCGC14_0541740 [marine sediment metagenome]|uniref:Uncharacterized protein n=1 Tax=marine sediment metagenome TaxID=412755 RepID=A0A0F9SB25_9ZZZZ